MKNIKGLRIKVSYYVRYLTVEVSDELATKFENAVDEGTLCCNDRNYDQTIEWCAENICEKDAIDWEYEFLDLEYEKD